jgi:hypothetical protein
LLVHFEHVLLERVVAHSYILGPFLVLVDEVPLR